MLTTTASAASASHWACRKRAAFDTTTFTVGPPYAASMTAYLRPGANARGRTTATLYLSAPASAYSSLGSSPGDSMTFGISTGGFAPETVRASQRGSEARDARVATKTSCCPWPKDAKLVLGGPGEIELRLAARERHGVEAHVGGVLARFDDRD